MSAWLPRLAALYRQVQATKDAGAGYELNLALAALAFVVALLGTGTFSLDGALRHLFGRAAVTTPPFGPSRRDPAAGLIGGRT